MNQNFTSAALNKIFQVAAILLSTFIVNTNMATAQKRSLVNKMWQSNYDTPVDSVPWGSSADYDSSGNILVTGSNDSSGHSWISTRMIAPTGIYTSWHAVYNFSNGVHNDYAARVVCKGSYVYVLGASYASNYDIVLIKYDLTGSRQWVYRYNGPGSGDDYPVAMTVDNYGNTYITGTAKGAGTAKDIVTIEVNSSGAQLWADTYDYANFNDYASGIVLAPDGNIYVSGATTDMEANREYTVLKYVYAEGFLTRSTVRENTTPFSLDMTVGIKADASSNLFITGGMSNDGLNYNIVTIKYNSALSRQWADTFKGDNHFNFARGLDIDGAGNIYVIGFKNDSYHPTRSMVVLKYKNSGTERWRRYKQMKDTSDSVESIAIDHDKYNNIFVAGTQKHLATWRQFTTKYDSSGRPLWDKVMEVDSATKAIATDVKVNNDSTIYGLVVNTTTTSKHYSLISYKNWDFRDSVAVPLDTTNKSSSYMTNQVIVRFKKSVLKSAIGSSTDKTFGYINEFLNGSAGTLMATKCGVALGQSRLIKVFKKFTSADSLSITRQGDTLRVPPFYLTMVLSLPHGSNVQTISDSLNKLDSLIYFAEVNHTGFPDAGANDGRYAGSQGSLHLITGSSDNSNINIEPAWDVENGGEKFIKIGVLDEGVDFLRQDYHFKIGDQSLAGSKVSGFDYDNQVPFSSFAGNPSFSGQHGTSCAGIIGAIRNNKVTTTPSFFGVVAGISGGDFLNGTTGCPIFSLMSVNRAETECVEAIGDAAFKSGTTNPATGNNGLGLSVISGSFGSDVYGFSFLEVVGFAYKQGVVYCASRGNDDTHHAFDFTHFPATYGDDDLVISVGACDVDGEFKHLPDVPYTGMARNNDDNQGCSWFGKKLDIIAPGTQLTVFTTSNIVDGSKTFSQTSAACPHVAGLAGLMMSRYSTKRTTGATNVDLAPEDVQNIIKNTATDKCVRSDIFYGTAFTPNRPPLPGYDQFSGWGLINAGLALQHVEYPNFKILHNTVTGSVDGTKTLAASFSTCVLKSDFKTGSTTIPAGTYSVDMYKVTLNASYTIPTSYRIVTPNESGQQSVWGRGSDKSTNVLGDLNWDLSGTTFLMPSITYDKVQSNLTTVEGFIYQITSGTFANKWIPFDPAVTNATMAYSIHIGPHPLAIKETEEPVHAKAYPVPATDHVELAYTLPTAGNVNLDVVDITGKTISTIIANKYETAGDYQVSYGSNALAPGVYIFRMTIKNQILYEKFVKTE